jgi:hypothetical protein
MMKIRRKRETRPVKTRRHRRFSSVRFRLIDCFNLQKALEILHEAKSVLRTSAIPSYSTAVNADAAASCPLVGRAKEWQDVVAFWDASVRKQKPSSLFMSGPPGTGKTLMVDTFLSRLEKVFFELCMGAHFNSDGKANVQIGEVELHDGSSAKQDFRALVRGVDGKGGAFWKRYA